MKCFLIPLVVIFLCLGCGGEDPQSESQRGLEECPAGAQCTNCVPSTGQSDCTDPETYCQAEAWGPGEPNECMMCPSGYYNCDGDDTNACESATPCS